MLDGKVALVTGAAGGIGRVLVDRLIQAGGTVVPVDIEEADVTNPADVARMITGVEAEHGGLDILVNNAGGYEEPVFPEAPLEHWSKALDLNLHSVMLVIQAAIPVLERRGGGAIGTSHRPRASAWRRTRGRPSTQSPRRASFG